jgi:hypothetical protein
MRYFVITLYVCCTVVCQGQLLQQNVFYGITNQDLYDKVFGTFKSNTTLDYGVARDTLYGRIDLVNDSLECIYTGMKVYIQPGSDPTISAFNGPGGGINAEHGYPQSKGAMGLGRSDMHILYPSRVAANSNRMSNPLLDIPDNLTQKWFVDDREQSNIPPSSVIDNYSESNLTAFEPRERSKGNLARSVFYFYTMYREQADAADPTFFNLQKNNLCRWHVDDPVDSVEWKRTWAIAKYQEAKPNPFVLDCSLVARMYCNNLDQACEELVRITSSTIDPNHGNLIDVFPNPFDNFISVQTVEDLGLCRVKLLDMYGRRVWNSEMQINIGTNMLFPYTEIKSAPYVLMVEDLKGRITSKLVMKK